MYTNDYSCPNCGALLYSDMWLESELIPFDKNAAAICKGCYWTGAVGEVRIACGGGPKPHARGEYVPDYQISRNLRRQTAARCAAMFRDPN